MGQVLPTFQALTAKGSDGSAPGLSLELYALDAPLGSPASKNSPLCTSPIVQAKSRETGTCIGFYLAKAEGGGGYKAILYWYTIVPPLVVDPLFVNANVDDTFFVIYSCLY